MNRVNARSCCWIWMAALLACVGPESMLRDDEVARAEDTGAVCNRTKRGRVKSSGPDPQDPSTAKDSTKNQTPAPVGERKPDAHQPRSGQPSYQLGQSDGGPGQWEQAPVRPKGAGYQQDVTGAPPGVEYAVPGPGKSGKVLFDGYQNGKLQDAKDWERWPPEDETFWRKGLQDEALRQISAAKGTPIEWHVSSQDKADAVRKVLNAAGLRGIDVKFTQRKNNR